MKTIVLVAAMLWGLFATLILVAFHVLVSSGKRK